MLRCVGGGLPEPPRPKSRICRVARFSKSPLWVEGLGSEAVGFRGAGLRVWDSDFRVFEGVEFFAARVCELGRPQHHPRWCRLFTESPRYNSCPCVPQEKKIVFGKPHKGISNFWKPQYR